MNQTIIAQDDLQAVDTKSETDSKEHDEPKTFLKLALWQVVRIKGDIFIMSISYQCK